MVERIVNEGVLQAIIVQNNFSDKGIHFFTEHHFSQQLAFMRHPKGKVIQPHIHNPVPREVHYTQEVLFIKKGKLKVNFYSDNKKYLESRILGKGDVVLLVKGGHGFEVVEEVEMFEVKQGPYAGDKDKTRFEAKGE